MFSQGILAHEFHPFTPFCKLAFPFFKFEVGVMDFYFNFSKVINMVGFFCGCPFINSI